MKFIFVLIFSGTWLNAFGQIEAGTFIALNSSQDEIVIAGDSRSTDRSSKFDDRCKITALGHHLVFAASGFTAASSSHGGPSAWDAHTIVRNIFLKLSRESDSSALPLPVRLADAWGIESQRKLELTFNWDRKALANAEGNELSESVFAWFDRGKPFILTGRMKYDIGPDGHVYVSFDKKRPTEGSTSVMLGDGNMKRELDRQRSRRSRRWMKALPVSRDPLATKTIGEVQFAIDHSRKILVGGKSIAVIGGPIDALRLTQDQGINWLKRKQGCPAD
jgi:hypothetical protein